jgi:hypothetical protein
MRKRDAQKTKPTPKIAKMIAPLFTPFLKKLNIT